MISSSRSFRLLLFALLAFLASAAVPLHAQEYQGRQLVHARLIADTTQIEPGKTFTAGLLLQMAPGWHSYYKEPGDSGLETRIEWSLPPGFSAGEIIWPEPEQHVEPGDLKVNIYRDEVLLMIPITAPKELSGTVHLKANASWLVCENLCIPGKATVTLDLPVGPIAPDHADLFRKYRAQVKPSAPAIDQAVTAPGNSSGGLAVNLLFGLIGGLLLNVMPCVLPVIALKIMGFVNQAGESRARTFRLGLAFVAGIYVWFVGLALMLAGFKMAGRDINWAFQFQNPWFVGIAFLLVFVFALNMLGVFEIVLPESANQRLTNLSAHEGYWGAFLHGVFATLLATPCTAPFLGPALGFALGRDVATILAIFTAVATGMSIPYLLLTANPGWLRFLPKPGMWMVRVKQFMGVLLLGTSFWLGWIVWQQQTKPQPAASFPVRLERALSTGKPVFIDFTADWCVNCKVNERLVLKSDAVQQAFREHEVQLVIADWTRGDAEITAALKRFGRAGVPLYVYIPNNGKNPVVFPELINTAMILDALKQ